ncbi:uncharacterized protein FIBRA_00474 [Fibroporia radiculosa]|uniref:Ig-like domain-containing protein n=1 Tax=Fibroporia radiculosa TaxID=599839 RepID=J4I7Y6_9APHY|nr:uncharacterized protein FIBRA_00474 [Fibroporia radiculosa]CCL98476.1 predicted protein [Fibroporia radiculosa]
MLSILYALGALVEALALPTGQIIAREVTPWCAGLGPGAFDIAHNFTLAALNTTLPNANATGAPLVLGQAGATDGESFEVFSTYASYPYNDWPNLSLLQGGLVANSIYNFTSPAGNVTSGNELSFVTTTYNAPPPAQIYCAVADIDPTEGSPYPLLAVNGDTSGFALCVQCDCNYAQTNLVWQPSPENADGYLYDTCYNVTVQLLGLN